jgi:hypothetical protein
MDDMNDGYWNEDGTWVPTIRERALLFIANLVPRPARHWPILRRWYWQPEELAAIRERARQQAAELRRWMQ